jgi:hypothetical protein
VEYPDPAIEERQQENESEKRVNLTEHKRHNRYGTKCIMSLLLARSDENRGTDSVVLESSFPRKRESRLVAPNWIPAFAGMTDPYLLEEIKPNIFERDHAGRMGNVFTSGPFVAS